MTMNWIKAVDDAVDKASDDLVGRPNNTKESDAEFVFRQAATLSLVGWLRLTGLWGVTAQPDDAVEQEMADYLEGIFLNTVGPRRGRGVWLGGGRLDVPESAFNKLVYMRDRLAALARSATAQPSAHT